MRVIEAHSIYGERIKIDMDFEEGMASGKLGAILMPLTDSWTVVVEYDDGTQEEIDSEDFLCEIAVAESDDPFC